jgi:hypothetical protein
MPLPKQTRLVLIATAAVLLAIGAAYLMFAVGLSGGTGQFLMRLRLKPNPAKLGPERAAATQRVHRALDELAAPVGLKPAPPAPGSPAEGLHDECYKGQHNFEVKDPYAYRCSLRITRYYGADGDFRQLLLDLDRTLATLGWKGGDLPRVVQDYYDRYYGPGKPKPANPSFDRAGGMYLVSDLPPPTTYRKSGLDLSLRYAERATTDLLPLELLQQVGHDAGATSIADQRRLVDATAVFRSVAAAHPYLVAIAAETDYFVK